METIVTLINKNYVVDDMGIEKAETTEEAVYAEVFPTTQNEFFKAGQSGFKPELMIKIWAFEYSGQNELKVNGDYYSVYRTYERPDEKIELYLERRSGNG